MLMNSLSREKGSVCLSDPWNIREEVGSIDSTEVKIALQLGQLRRRQTELLRFWGLELLTDSFEPQYIQTMTTY